MPDFELVLRKPDEGEERFTVPPEGLTIGRQSENDICLSSHLVSRRHAKVWVEQGKMRIKDLDSRNGIRVNGLEISEATLFTGDSLVVGEYELGVGSTSPSSLRQRVIGPEQAAELHQSMISTAQDGRLPVLYEAAQLLGSVFNLDELLKQILALIFGALPVRRGFVLTLEEGAAEPAINAVLSREEEDQGPPLSKTLVQHVFDTRDAMMTLDAQDDSRFDHADSILGHNIHSAMCAPLCGREAVVGAIYVDSGTKPKEFTNQDLELLAAIARVVGVAVENARLYRENVQQERLAAIGHATAGLGHCIKNILTGIRGGTEFINMAMQNEDVKYLNRGWPILSRAIERIDMLVMNMLTFSKGREPELMPTLMADLIKDVLAVVHDRAEKANVELHFDRGDVDRVRVDSREIYRVVLNLVINAVEACERKGGSVTVSLKQLSGEFRMSVSDTGIGIPEDILPRLSQAFVSSKGSSGTGLGLACSYKIVREHGGRIEVESEVGKGTAFNVFLPLGDEISEEVEVTMASPAEDEA